RRRRRLRRGVRALPRGQPGVPQPPRDAPRQRMLHAAEGRPMTMLRSRARAILVVVALAAAAGLVVELASSGGGGRAVASADPHGRADVPAGKVRRVLAATEAASTG